MNNQIKKFLAALGLTAIALTGANGAYYNTVDSSYNTDLRITVGTPSGWSNPDITPSARYLNNNFSSGGNLLFGSGNSAADPDGLYEVNASTGAIEQYLSLGTANNTRSLVEVGGWYFYNDGAGNNILSKDTTGTGTTFNGASGVSTALAGVRSLTTDGTYVYASTDSSLIRYSVNSGTGALTTNWVSTALAGGQVRGLSYSDAFNGTYVWSAASTIGFVDSSGNYSSIGSIPSGVGAGLEWVLQFSKDGTDYLSYRDSSGYLTFAELSSATTFSGVFDRYDLDIGGLNAGDIRGASFNDSLSYLYLAQTGSGAPYPIRAFEITAIPEPSTYAMLALGMAMSAYGLRVSRRKKQVAQKA